MIERCSCPRCRRVARRACSWEPRRRVVWISRAGVIRLMARVAIRGYRGVVVVHVAIGAGHRGVRPSQRERRVVVIKRRRLPCRGVVAQVASLRESRRHMVGSRGAIKVGEMASNTSRVIQAVIVVDVTLCALQGSVRSS